MIKMVALDLDNTLLNSNKEISQRNEHVLKQLHQEGIKVVLCTGRPINAKIGIQYSLTLSDK